MAYFLAQIVSNVCVWIIIGVRIPCPYDGKHAYDVCTWNEDPFMVV